MVVATLSPPPHRAEAGAATQMRDDDAAARRRQALAQRDRHVFVRQAVKAVAPDAPLPERVRQWQHFATRWQRWWKAVSKQATCSRSGPRTSNVPIASSANG